MEDSEKVLCLFLVRAATTFTIPRVGSNSHNQSSPTTTPGISQGRIMIDRMMIDLVKRDIITAMIIASTVWIGMLSRT